ncbi:MAG: hypothetical protein WEC37_00900 [Anaerolineales bacterium]
MSFFSHDTGTAVAIRFLRDYAEFGAFSHTVASDAFKGAMATAKSGREKKLLAAKSFMELMNAIEDLAGLCVAIKHREEGLGLIYGFVMYDRNDKNAPSTKIFEFYDAIERGEDPIKFLGFPTLEEIKQANIELSKGVLNHLRTEMIRLGSLESGRKFETNDLMERLYADLRRVFGSAAKNSTAQNKLLVRAYNQVKHGFKVIENTNVFGNTPFSLNDEQCLIILRNPAYLPGQSHSEPVLDFWRVDAKDFEGIVTTIGLLGKAAKVICLLTAAFLEGRQIKTSDEKV